MPNIKKEIEEKFGNRLRTRVNGILVRDNKILMIKHRMGEGRFFWNVPGGGMKYGSSAPENLIREFKEETGLHIQVDEYLFLHEFLEPPLHAIELYFAVSVVGGKLELGKDPELDGNSQLISEIQFLGVDDIEKISNKEKHAMFWGIKSADDLGKWKGYFNFGNKCIN
ncbi:NUDIX hydrolase family protein [Lunatimonas lonarensis]|uniref:NUDIX hydrolase family protein n=1 Tax=Lunatimonas lonarensis TaxID=1232681 RepID=R7ZQF9_9BACT|nr:NUDIX hydrolase [Lunatimonas lonarensis]EON76288.1 NUDIX hydrolase family protein [Lunatimonas lonarensis]